ncbi:hypothetical protein BO70DRAFT_429021 [Aspergillus heteromorphus CBS 117.55]|uniref:BTB domain-containing protein n=1 Tax=Aspergillus heteromorphus CBS 117.55 TaxID=1448321 RepID=A0A317W9W0_9EURO|nr:uncharacterized protein BO70DRAFT_429021 [Aspergillus heteromorphus CBS 117.55]PWY82959.1 hypothetical protein BO70DRAFT_429021 [Aspergillus heteromorphus CBS 117.55]
MSVSKKPSYYEFLSSGTVSLCTRSSTRSFQIHRALLDSKCKVMRKALNSGFSEARENKYTCEDTADGTLARFVEWAYRGDYVDPLKPPAVGQMRLPPPLGPMKADTGSGVPSTNDDEPAGEEVDGAKLTAYNYLLVTHVRVYIFAQVYLIDELRYLAYCKLTGCLIEMHIPVDSNQQLAVINMLHLAFGKIPANDELLSWLAQYASYYVEQLRQHPCFDLLLRTCPALGASMMNSLQPSLQPPWQSGKQTESILPCQPANKLLLLSLVDNPPD